MTHFLKYFARVPSAQKTCNSEHTWDLKLQRISCHSRSSGKVFHLCGHDDAALAPWRVWKVCHTHRKCTWQPHYREPLDDQTIASQLGKTFDRTHNCKAGLLFGSRHGYKLLLSVSIHLIKTEKIELPTRQLNKLWRGGICSPTTFEGICNETVRSFHFWQPI